MLIISAGRLQLRYMTYSSRCSSNSNCGFGTRWDNSDMPAIEMASGSSESTKVTAYLPLPLYIGALRCPF